MIEEACRASSAKLLVVRASGRLAVVKRASLAEMFDRGDLVIGNDAATLPASLSGRHVESGAEIEVRLAGWIRAGDARRFVALIFGAGDHRTATEDRPAPPPLALGDRLVFGPLTARIENFQGHPRLVSLRFAASGRTVMAGLARHGRPIQYSHAPSPYALWDVWTKFAADPVAFEPPSAGFALDWAILSAWRRRGVGFATLTHAAGLSSTGDAALDRRLPLDEPYFIPDRTAISVREAKARGARIVAVGTSVVRALESAATPSGGLRSGAGLAHGRIGRGVAVGIADAILTGVHRPGESHYELLRAFAPDEILDAAGRALAEHGFKGHEFGDSVLIERAAAPDAAFEPATGALIAAG
ncbi:MAG TPA: S-adenosylmethionine:tRNA ribosyltransferase-isomerase [Roseiarcus sp.]|nr:S-adenosylmethionine:tRNA ribosyltransferase-isomerase [Roseiarcus sp.]